MLWREKEAKGAPSTRELRETSAAAFDPTSPRAAGPLVGRKREQRVIKEQLAAAPSAGLRAVVIEGEAGIGKTRMLEETADFAHGNEVAFWALNVAADEELRGPFLLFRSMLNSPRLASIARDAMALERLDRAQGAIGGGSSSAMEGLSVQEQMLRIFDEVTSVFSTLAVERPLALLFDDLQWADEDSIQLIRYLVRTLPTAPIFLLITIRPYTESSSAGATKLIADLDRMRVTEMLRLERFTRLETAELLQNMLGAPVDDPTLQSLHTRSEGVPFFIEEFARAYREADALQLMDGTWTMTRLSGPAVPSSVQSLIERRLAQLSEDCRSLLADAGVLGRRFRLRDLIPVLAQIRREEERPEWELAEDLDMAVRLGLIVEEPQGADYDFSFSHDQIRAALLEGSPRRRQQAIHGAIAEMLASREGAQDFSMLAYHSMKAGNNDRAISSAVAAAKAALEVSAPEESIRLIDATLPAASDPEDRIEMLRVKDDALNVLDRGMDRIANLAEMSALTGAIASKGLESEVDLRRASASRAIEDFEMAVELANSVRESAVELGDLELELSACFELGQALTQTAIGEGYWPLGEVDLDPAEEAYSRALLIAREIGSRLDEAVALRELSVIEGGRARHTATAAAERGTSKFEILAMGPTLFAKSKELAEQALHIFEDLGDQRGAMSALISMAYAHITDPTAHGMAGRIEHIRALHNAKKGDVTGSRRANEDALMLYSIHTYARLNAQLDLALERGRETYTAARALGDRWLEVLAAGGVAMTYASFSDTDQASAWLDRAAAAARSVPSTSMARRLEMWRGACAAVSGQPEQAQEHYERAATLAGKKSLAGKAEAYCALAIESAKLGALTGNPSVLNQARRAAEQTLECVRPLPGQMPWESVAHAVMAVVADSEGRSEEAADEARVALTTLDGLTHILHFLNVLWAAGRVLIAKGAPESEALIQQIAQGIGYLSMNMTDPQVRARWLEVPSHRELCQLVGFSLDEGMEETDSKSDLTEQDLSVLRVVTSGSAEGEISRDEVSDLLAKLGVQSETEPTEYAIKAGVTWQ
ncbi:MAG: AAA family ATPase [Acidimicrobiia bacterium]